jgi:methyltransferase family protein
MSFRAFSRRAPVVGAAAVVGIFLSAGMPASAVEDATSPYLATPQKVVDVMLKAAAVKPEDVVVDLGSGDGRIVITAVKNFHARKGVGIEINPNLVRLARDGATKAGVSNRVEFRNDDLFAYDLNSATVITIYLLPEVNLKLRPKLLALKPGTRIVTHQFGMGDWQPDASIKALDDRDPQGPATVYSWTVPAKVGGTWRWQEGKDRAELAIRQKFQKIEPSFKVANIAQRIEAPDLAGDRIFFIVVRDLGPYDYEGRVAGNKIDGKVTGPNGVSLPWTAERSAPEYATAPQR